MKPHAVEVAHLRIGTTMGKTTRPLDVSELSNLALRVGEIEEQKECRSFVIYVECKSFRWTVRRRYTDFRELREELCTLIVQSEDTCSERCHFLTGVQLDKFPRRIFIHSRGALEARAIDLDAFLQKIVLRLNLCSKVELETCAGNGCQIIALLAKFLNFPNTHELPPSDKVHRFLMKPETYRHSFISSSTRCIRTASIVS